MEKFAFLLINVVSIPYIVMKSIILIKPNGSRMNGFSDSLSHLISNFRKFPAFSEFNESTFSTFGAIYIAPIACLQPGHLSVCNIKFNDNLNHKRLIIFRNI